MKKNFQFLLLLLFLLLGINSKSYSQQAIKNQIADSLTAIANINLYAGKIKVNSININNSTKTIVVIANERLGNIPFREENVNRIYAAISKIVGKNYTGYKIYCKANDTNIEDFIPNFYRTEKYDKSRQFKVLQFTNPLVTNISRLFEITSGLQNKNIAVWQSHGWYYDQKSKRWKWQRARYFQTVEDLYAQSYIIPFLMPMLENAGANVLSPRERDSQVNEIIVDNDTKKGESRYKEHNNKQMWVTGDKSGFANTKDFYVQGENPFTLGTYRKINTTLDKDEFSTIDWIPDFPETSRYAVYVSYHSTPRSSTDAHYTVYHKGGKTEFIVNQSMSGSTWVYLGQFQFDEGRSYLNKVTLSNVSSEEGTIITADAVKFGGGMGNIARSPAEFTTVDTLKTKNSDTIRIVRSYEVYKPKISSHPRFTEAARYWLQWAGIPDSVYSKNKGTNDYTDDFQSRGFWVNYLSGGSQVAPKSNGLKVPIDLAFAFHTDAGVTINDSIIGTLGICSIQNTDKKTIFSNGVSRFASHDLTDIIQTQIVDDIRKTHAPEWTRRGLWNKSYSESRVPEVPTMLLELLSHQNFADMRYGLDPRFRFTVSRAIYKGMLKYLASSYESEYVVQPLPVKQFSCQFIDNNKFELHWLATRDSLEPTAIPDQYVLYTRIDSGDFNSGEIVKSNRIVKDLQPGKIYSFKITAVNKGGESFPSEILSAHKSLSTRPEVLIVNCFDRISAPKSYAMDSTFAGFMDDDDAGVPYLSDISYTGKQFEFKRSKPWVSDDAPGFGASHANYETEVIAGNTFDYPYIHGKAIKAAGYSFVSCSRDALTSGDVDIQRYKVVDLILGKQKQTFIGNAKKAPEFKTFPLALQNSISEYCAKGGNLIISGSYIGSDIMDAEKPNPQDVRFIENVLKIKFRTAKASVNGDLSIVLSPIKAFHNMNLSYYNEPNSISYFVESPDAIEPIDNDSYTICRYKENNQSAGVAYSGKYKICSFGFPIETIKSEKEISKLMSSILLFFNN